MNGREGCERGGREVVVKASLHFFGIVCTLGNLACNTQIDFNVLCRVDFVCFVLLCLLGTHTKPFQESGGLA